MEIVFSGRCFEINGGLLVRSNSGEEMLRDFCVLIYNIAIFGF